MTDLDILKQMIRDTARVPADVTGNNVSVILTEPQSSSSKVVIGGLPDDAVVIKADAFIAPDSIFSGTRGECKRADYVIIAETDRGKFILHIEMKTTKAPLNEIIAQLTGSACFVKYCREIGKSSWHEAGFLSGYEQRFVSLAHTSVRKRRTRITPQSRTHDQPDKLLKIDWPARLPFNKLIGAWPQDMG